ncbi:MAG: DUF2851 family protein [Candidatus Tenebribacter davisii]|nr:DUF2851 family protein [Candidatus Tenebribacter davisii]
MKFTEEFLYHIWDAQHLNEKLFTQSGKQVNIKFPGRWNTDSGPDFKDAIIEVDTQTLKGDVEIDLTSYHWKSHSHHENPEFNNVLLHLVYENKNKKPYTISENGTRIEILEVKDQLTEDISKLIKHYSNKPYSEKDRSCDLFNNMNITETEQFLKQMGMKRFEKKIKRFTAEHFFSDFDQLFYMGFMEALGYSKNKYQMMQIASNLTYKNLKEFYNKGMTKEEFISILLCSSGIIEHIPSIICNEQKLKWISLFQKFPQIQILDISWKLFRVRPINHPAVRILQVTDIIYDSLETSIFHNILKPFSFPKDNFILRDFKNKLYAYFQIKNNYLPERYKLGKTRIDTLLINIILPLAVVYSREKKYNNLEGTVYTIYQSFSGLPSNFLTQYMEKFLNIEQKKIVKRNAINQQGLLNIYYEYCKHHLCEACSSK